MQADKVRIHVITYRRVHLLSRALKSIQNQTHQNWIAEVINDDPTDHSVKELIDSLNDERIFLSEPLVKRGGTGNFNYCFRSIEEPFASILEDDNWFEPMFLSVMLAELKKHENIAMAVGNETIWAELPNNQWENTKRTIWEQQNGSSIFEYRLFDKCGRAKVCNSSMLWRTANAEQWQTPKEIPIDVTEHFRERVIPHPLLLVHQPLVNFAQTMQTYRGNNGDQWNIYQTLLVASIFEVISKVERKELAQQLWLEARTHNKLFSTTLLNAALACKNAGILFTMARPAELFRFLLTIARRPKTAMKCAKAIQQHKNSWDFLLKAFQKNSSSVSQNTTG